MFKLDPFFYLHIIAPLYLFIFFTIYLILHLAHIKLAAVTLQTHTYNTSLTRRKKKKQQHK